ncbi:MAG: ABC transporter ATP-binding protein [Actinomycetota bacterium]|nr:ABC transporter ATP-binding protein [Actinomycetota bacterium]
MPVIDVSGLVVRYPGGVTAVDGLSFSAEAGEVLALLGPNGAGKTTTVETLEGYKSPTAGSVRVLGLDPVRDHARLTPRIGVMLQKGGVYPGIKPVEALRLFAAFYDAPEDPTALLERVGLSGVAATPWRRLSGGEQQRLSLALALVGRPEVAFLDEPTAGVDVAGRHLIREVIADLRAQGTCVLLATHELDEAERVADRALIVDHGKLLASGTTVELTSPTGRATVDFGAPPGLDVAALSAHLGTAVVEVRPGQYQVEGEPSPATVAALTAWLATHDVALADLRAGRSTLEDVFLRLTGGA